MTTAQPKHLRYPLRQPGAYLELTAQAANGRPAIMQLRLEETTSNIGGYDSTDIVHSLHRQQKGERRSQQ